MKIAFLDTLGLPYDPTVLDRRGLGGSESAVINIAYELAKLGDEIVVFNRCGEDDTKAGVYNGVEYRNIKGVWYPGVHDGYDVVISSRSLHPFVGHADYANILENNPYKILYMHDTFCQGSDHVLEQMVVDKKVDTIFTLSDFHTDYVTTCNHGVQRNFETLKPHIFQTRNGAVRHPIKEVVIADKDPDLFVFNASYTKGMSTLVRDVWPRFKQYCPKAKLIVIGGYYRFPDRKPDQQELDWQKLCIETDKIDDVTFTGVITQYEIAQILAKASYFVALGGFPETFGISILEALLYNTPVICNRFGAAEETAPDICSYKLDYAVTPNSLWPDIPVGQQIKRFVQLMVMAYQNKYLWHQKANACNIVKPLAGWDTIALQWQQHFAHHFGVDVPDPDKVRWINQRVHKIFNRRFANAEDFL